MALNSTSKFAFVKDLLPDVFKALCSAEQILHNSPTEALVAMRRAVESLAIFHIPSFEQLGIEKDGGETFFDYLDKLAKKWMLPNKCREKIKHVWQAGNEAAHPQWKQQSETYWLEQARGRLKDCYDIVTACVEQYRPEKKNTIPTYVEPQPEKPPQIPDDVLDSYCCAVVKEFKELDPPFLVFPNVAGADAETEAGQLLGQLLEANILFVRGSPGTGKTYLATALQGLCAASWLADGDTNKVKNLLKSEDKHRPCVILQVLEGASADKWKYIPLALRLREFRTSSTLMSQLVGYARFRGLTAQDVERSIETYLLEKGKAFVVLDGLDELGHTDEDQAIAEIRDFAAKYPKNRFLITSRKDIPQFLSRLRLPDPPKTLRIYPLDENGAKRLVERRMPDAESNTRQQVLSQISALQPTPLNVCVACDVRANARNETELYLKHTKSLIRRELKKNKNRYTQLTDPDSYLSMAGWMAYEMHKGTRGTAAREDILEYLRNWAKSQQEGAPRCAEEGLLLLEAAGILQIDNEEACFGHAAFRETLAAYELSGRIERGVFDIDGPEFTETILPQPLWDYVVLRLLHICALRNNQQSIDRTIHHLLRIDIARAVVMVRDFRVPVSDDASSEIDDACAKVCNESDWQALGHARYWLRSGEFEELMEDRLPYFWSETADSKADFTRNATEEQPHYSSPALRFLHSLTNDTEFRSSTDLKERIQQVNVYPQDVYKAVLFWDVKQWRHEHLSPESKPVDPRLYDLLDKDKSQQLLALEELSKEYSLETATRLSSALENLRKARGDEDVLSKMVLHLAKIGFLHVNDAGFRNIMLDLSRYVDSVIENRTARKQLVRSAHLASFLLREWDLEAKLAAAMDSEPLDEFVGAGSFATNVEALRDTPEAWLFMKTRTVLQEGTDAFKEHLEAAEEQILAFDSQTDWPNLSPDEQQVLLAKMFVNLEDSSWAVFRDYFIPACSAADAAILNWYDWCEVGYSSDLDEAARREVFSYQLQKIKELSGLLKSAHLPGKLLYTYIIPPPEEPPNPEEPERPTGAWENELRLERQATLSKIRASTTDLNTDFFVRFWLATRWLDYATFIL